MEASAGVRVPNPSLPSQLMILGVWRRVNGGLVGLVRGKEMGLERERLEEMVRRGTETEAVVVVMVVAAVLRRSIFNEGKIKGGDVFGLRKEVSQMKVTN